MNGTPVADAPGSPDRAFRLQALRRHSSASPFLGRTIRWFSTTASTNDDCKRLTEELGHSVVVVADRQTAGRGQYGRQWEAPTGLGLLASVSLLNPPPESALLSAWASVATAAMLERAFDLKATVKWPNDVLVGERKIAGVLIEVGKFAVVGIGLNVLQQPNDFPPDCRLPPTSILMETNVAGDRVAAAAALLDELERVGHPADDAAQQRIVDAWRERHHLKVGEIVVAETRDGKIAGGFIELHPVQGLEMRTPSGVVEVPSERLLRMERA